MPRAPASHPVIRFAADGLSSGATSISDPLRPPTLHTMNLPSGESAVSRTVFT